MARILIEQYNADRDARNKEGQVPFDLVSAPDDPRWVGVLKGPFPVSGILKGHASKCFY